MKNYLCMFTDTVKKKKKKKYTTKKIQLNLWMLIPNETHKIRISRDYAYTLACCLTAYKIFEIRSNQYKWDTR